MQRFAATIALLASAVALPTFTSAFQTGSQGRVMWENDCDFYGKDLRTVRGIPDVCGNICAGDNSCSHWTWTTYNGGTCWLKQTSSNTKLQKYGAGCGYVIGRFSLTGSSTNQGVSTPAPAPAASNNGLNVVENQAMLNSVNAYRAQNGLVQLRMDSRLHAASAVHSQDQANRCTMTHDGADGSKAWDRMATQGYSWSTAAENVAAGQTSVDQVMTSWWNSPGHRANILNADVRDVGFGKAVNNGCGNYKTYWTQDFGKSS
ncbi:Scp-like extracellular protein [Globisporangium polare]